MPKNPLLLTDKELLRLDSRKELALLQKWVLPKSVPTEKPERKEHKLYPYINILALRRTIAKAQLAEINNTKENSNATRKD